MLWYALNQNGYGVGERERVVLIVAAIEEFYHVSPVVFVHLASLTSKLCRIATLC